MLAHDSRFRELAKAPVKQSNVEVVKQELDIYGYYDDTPFWTSGDFLMEVKIDSLGEMLGAVTKKATVKLIGIRSGFEIGDIFQVRVGLYDEDPSVAGFNYISQGFFRVEEIDYDYDAGFTLVTMYDAMWRANKLIYSETIPEDTFTYPITVQDLAQAIAETLNIELQSEFYNLPNSGHEIEEDLYSDITAATLQNVIQHIAGATGSTARITDTTLNFVPFEVVGEELTANELRTLKVGETYGPVNSVVLGRVPTNDNIALFSQDPNEYEVESVDTGTDLITITDHGMLDGNMIYFTSDDTLPAPLQANVPYFVFTNDESDTFALTSSYSEATQPRSYLEFDGAEDFVTWADDDIFGIDADKTFAITVYNENTSGTAQIYNKRATQEGLEIYQSDDDLVVKLADDSTVVTSTVTGVFSTQAWTRILVSIDTSSDMIVYVDGEVEDSQDISSLGTMTNSDSADLARRNNGTPQYFEGKISRFEIYDGAMSESNALSDFNGNFSGVAIGRWTFEDDGLILTDSSESGVNGYLGTNFITNPDLEDEDISEFIPYVTGGDANDPTILRDGVEMDTGFYSLEVVGDGASTYSGVQIDLTGLTTSEDYRITARYKGTADDVVNVYADVTGDPDADFTATGEWQTVNLDFTASGTTASIYFRTSADDATFYLDNMAAYKVGAEWGTNRDTINLTSSGAGTISIEPTIVQEIQINNNEILDDYRQTLIQPLYNVLAGINWSYVKAQTIGLGYHEVGDVVQFTENSTTVNAFINEVHLVLDGAIRENLLSEVPEVASIDYKAAGGITKTLYNTEIKVDKQDQTITSIVSEQSNFEGETLENFTQVQQDIENIELTVQKAGGGNLLLNSVGFARENFEDSDGDPYDKLLFWDYNDSYDVSDNGTTTSYTSSESQNFGGISGQVVEMQGTDMLITQRIDIAVNTPMSFGVLAKNIQAQGEATITLSNDNETYEIVIDDAQDYIWEEFSIINFTATLPWFNVTIAVDNALKFMFTDLRLTYGTNLQGWVQANSEILSANVQFTKDGMRIFDSVHDTETRVTFNEFSTRRKTDGEVLFEADDIGVLTNNLTIKGGTNYLVDDETIIKQITIGSANPKAGLAFIKVLEEE